MNEKKLLKNQLHFLEETGFKVKCKSKNSENEIYYNKGNLTLEFLFDTCSLSLDVVVDHSNNRTNIFDSEIFDKEKLIYLRAQINSVKMLKDLNQQFILYSKFIKDNLNLTNVGAEEV